jgi:hypothetical protein
MSIVPVQEDVCEVTPKLLNASAMKLTILFKYCIPLAIWSQRIASMSAGTSRMGSSRKGSSSTTANSSGIKKCE